MAIIPKGYYGVRDWVTNQGGTVGWDPTKGLSINGTVVNRADYVNDNGRTYMDPAKIQSYLQPGMTAKANNIPNPANVQTKAPPGFEYLDSGNSGSKKTDPATQSYVNAAESQIGTTPANWPYYEKLLLDLMNQAPAYTPLGEDEMTKLSQQYAGLQIDPLLSELTSQEQSALTNATSAQDAINAAYSGVKDAASARLAEAHTAAVEDGVARGMGRSGVVDWKDAQLAKPILSWEQQQNAEKAAKISQVANALTQTQSDIARRRTEAGTSRGELEASQLASLRNQNTQMAQQAQQQKISQAMQIANLALQDKGIDQNALFNLLNQILAG